MMFAGEKGSNEPTLPSTAVYSMHFRINSILLLKTKWVFCWVGFSGYSASDFFCE